MNRADIDKMRKEFKTQQVADMATKLKKQIDEVPLEYVLANDRFNLIALQTDTDMELKAQIMVTRFMVIVNAALILFILLRG